LSPADSILASSRRIGRDPYQGLPEIAAFQHFSEHLGGSFQARADIFSVDDPTVLQPSGHAREEGVLVISDEFTHHQRKDSAPLALEDGLAGLEPGLARIAAVGVAILRNQAAAGDTRALVQQPQNRFEGLAADILEVDIDAIRTGRSKIVLACIEPGWARRL
jgi:hypothetical protein